MPEAPDLRTSLFLAVLPAQRSGASGAAGNTGTGRATMLVPPGIAVPVRLNLIVAAENYIIADNTYVRRME